MAVYGRYETVREISQTGLGSVWIGREAGMSGSTLGVSTMLRSTLQPGEKLVVKLFQPVGYAPRDPQFEADALLFLKRAEAQRRVAERGAKRWARVHAAGRCEDGAYCVQDAHGRSINQLLLRKVDLWRTGAPRDPGSTLRAIVSGIVEALREMSRLSEGRGHGALKPSNILLAGEGPLASATVILTDPMPDRIGPGAYAARDKHDLGALIYQLVTHKPYREAGGWPVQFSPEWAAYGRRGGHRWLDLCNRLLDPRDASALPSLEIIAQELADWPLERAGRRVPVIAAAVVVLALAGGGAAWWATRGPDKVVLDLGRGQLDQMKDDINWIDGLAPVATDSRLVAAAAADPGLARVLAQVNEYTRSDSLSRAIKYLRYERSLGDPEPTVHGLRESNSDLWRIYEPLTAALAEWPAARDLAGPVAAAFEERGWRGAAAESRAVAARYDAILASRPSTARASGADKPAEEVRADEAMRRVVETARAAGQIEAAWSPLRRQAEALSQNEDAVLRRFAEVVDARAAAAANAPGDAIDGLRRELADLKPLADRLEQARRTAYAKADLEYFAERSEVHRRLREVEAAGAADGASPELLAILRDWPAEIARPEFVRIPIGDVWKGREAQAEVAAAASDLAKLDARRQPGDEARLDPMTAQLRDVQSRFADLQKRLEMPKRREYEAIRDEATEMLASLDALKVEIEDLKAVRLQAFEAYLPAFRARQLDSGSAVLDGEYARLRDSIDRAHAASQDIGELRTPLMRVEKTLAALAGRVEPHGLTGPAAAVAEAEREALLAGAIGRLPRDAEGLPQENALESAAFVEYWSKASAEYEAWLVAAKVALREVDDIAARLADGYGPGFSGGPDGGGTPEGPDSPTLAERWAALRRDPAFGKILEQQESLRSIGDRLKRLQATEAISDPAALAEAIEEPAAGLAERLAAWKRLRALPGPGWPDDEAALRQAAELLSGRLNPAIDTAASAPRREELAAWSVTEARSVWTGFVESRGGEAARAGLDAAVELAPVFGVDEGVVTSLPPGARFNVMLSRLRADLARLGPRADDESVKARLRRFEADAGSLGLADPAVTGLLAGVHELVNAPPKKEIKLSEVGPGKAGWPVVQQDPEGDWVMYAAPAGVLPPVQLRFWRVSKGDQRGGPPAAYLAENEVSLAVFTALVEAGRGGLETARLLGRAKLDGESDLRKGPTAWNMTRKTDRSAEKAPVLLRVADAKKVGQGWLNVVPGMDGPQDAYYPAGLDVPRPVVDTPMNYLPATAALYAARLANCRLPTPQEWAAGVARNQPGKANIRDQSWANQRAYVAGLTKPQVLWPDADIFIPDELKAQIRRQGSALPASEQDVDQTLWFAPVNAPGFGEPFRHLTGNVAELVAEASPRFDEMTPAEAAGNTDWSGLKVVGGSALAAAEINAAEAYAAGSANVGYSDVGFRLAFSAGEGAPKPLIVQAGELLRTAAFLPPRGR